MQYLKDYIFEIYHLLLEMSPYLLLGFLIAGILKFSFKPGTFKKHMGEANLRSVVNAALLGVPMPLCSCGVIPTGIGLYRNGASRGATQSFLISTPQTGVDSIMITYSLLGLPFAIIRPIAAFLTGIAGGVITNKVEGEKPHEYSNGTTVDDRPKGFRRITAILKYAFIDFMNDIAKWLAIGILVAGLISVLLPDDFFMTYLSNPYLSMLVMLVASIPLYVCATSSVPVAAALIMKGLSPGAALVFLMAGPATNAATISVIGNTLGKKSLIVYLGTIIIGSFAGGIFLDQFMPASWFTGIMAMGHDHHMLPEWLMISSTVILTGLIIYALIVKTIHKAKGKNIDTCEVPIMSERSEKLIHIEGMSCQHCVMNVKKGLSSLDGVTEVDVNLEAKIARIKGQVDDDKIKATINELGYTVKGIE